MNDEQKHTSLSLTYDEMDRLYRWAEERYMEHTQGDFVEPLAYTPEHDPNVWDEVLALFVEPLYLGVRSFDLNRHMPEECATEQHATYKWLLENVEDLKK